jgi:hypothetical protein
MAKIKEHPNPKTLNRPKKAVNKRFRKKSKLRKNKSSSTIGLKDKNGTTTKGTINGAIAAAKTSVEIVPWSSK